MKKITLLAAFFAAFAMNSQVTVWEDSFESYSDFEIAAIGTWSQIDNDASPTYGSTNYDFTNEAYVGTAIVFNPSMTTPDASGDTAWQVRTGEKGLYMFAATSLLNDDYIITPQIDLSGAAGSSFTFYAKSLTADFGLERFEVLLSTTGTAEGDFTVNLSGGELQAPVDVYTEYTYDLSAYDGMPIYIAIHYVAQDSFVFQMDDFIVEATTLGVNDNVFKGFTYFVDANNQLNLRANLPMDGVQLYNVLGQQVLSRKLSGTTEAVNISALTSGVYIASVIIDGQKRSYKIVKK
ncbi:T9SS-dependent choice-of-anchor J family protein [Ulvibacter sp. MAR_2010_11]|uniref:T9SS-dependent choice-of-anchor J family protein n=1 Tax=Ulvibacter sp. MAR_2010_11 TaxID=1250229 RepID=UPI0018E27D1C|nr:choice-of-anchor J domain-containing protein [Ulvibacter sp. MAR_2010_11]